MVVKEIELLDFGMIKRSSYQEQQELKNFHGFTKHNQENNEYQDLERLQLQNSFHSSRSNGSQFG